MTFLFPDMIDSNLANNATSLCRVNQEDTQNQTVVSKSKKNSFKYLILGS